MWCGKCKLEKPDSDFSKNRSRKSGFQHRCKKCVSLHAETTTVQRSIRCKNYYVQNRIALKLKANRYYKNNKKKCLEAQRVYLFERRKSDPIFRLRQCVSHQIRQNIKKQAGTKGESIFKYLPYTLKDLREHLEGQFEPWMSWENYGGKTFDGAPTWWIDHIVPQSKLPYDSMQNPNFLICWNLGNLRPMEKKLNIQKGNK